MRLQKTKAFLQLVFGSNKSTKLLKSHQWSRCHVQIDSNKLQGIDVTARMCKSFMCTECTYEWCTEVIRYVFLGFLPMILCANFDLGGWTLHVRHARRSRQTSLVCVAQRLELQAKSIWDWGSLQKNMPESRVVTDVQISMSQHVSSNNFSVHLPKNIFIYISFIFYLNHFSVFSLVKNGPWLFHSGLAWGPKFLQQWRVQGQGGGEKRWTWFRLYETPGVVLLGGLFFGENGWFFFEKNFGDKDNFVYGNVEIWWIDVFDISLLRRE